MLKHVAGRQPARSICKQQAGLPGVTCVTSVRRDHTLAPIVIPPQLQVTPFDCVWAGPSVTGSKESALRRGVTKRKIDDPMPSSSYSAKNQRAPTHNIVYLMGSNQKGNEKD
jgi:hypothetical protein